MAHRWWIVVAGSASVFLALTWAVQFAHPTTTAADLVAGLRQERERLLGHQVILATSERSWRFTLAELGLVIEPDRIWQEEDSAMALRWDLQRFASTVEPVARAVERTPVSATIELVNHQPTITPEQMGVTLDQAALLHGLQTLGEGTDLIVPLLPVAPAQTRQSLEAMQIRRMIASWSTQYDPAIPRAENVERAAKAFNGLRLKPGAILSYNGTVGTVSLDTGWKEAFVIVNGQLVPGVGGGVCQVATTLYGAALRANLEILERHPHQLSVPYMPPSQDAAITAGAEDLKIRNTTMGSLLFETEWGGGTVTFHLYGDLPADETIQIESVVTGQVPYTVRSVVDSALAPGVRQVKLAGRPGIRSEGYRLVYRAGRLIKRELLSTDLYQPSVQVETISPNRIE